MEQSLDTTAATCRIAPFFPRYLAFIIDYFTITFFTISLYPLFLPKQWDTLTITQINLSFIPLYLLYILLFFSKDLYKARSWGKFFTSIQIHSMEESLPKAGIKQSFIRNISLIFLPIELVFLLKDKYFRRKGDYIAKTVVLEHKQNFTIRALTLRVLSAIFLISFCWILTNATVPIALKKRTDYKIALTQLQNSQAWQNITQKTTSISFNYWFSREETKNDITYILPFHTSNKQAYTATITLQKLHNKNRLQNIHITKTSPS